MKEILDKLEKLFNDAPELKTSNNLISTSFKWKELYQLFKFAKECNSNHHTYSYLGVDPGGEDQTVYHCTVIGDCGKVHQTVYHCTPIGDCGKVHQTIKEWQECKDCGKVHQTIKEWQECKDCDTMMQKKRLTDED